MEPLAKSKVAAIVTAVTADPRWVIEDELMCQVLGFTLYGYAFGVGRLFCFMEVADIQKMAADELTALGIGPQYATGMMECAHQEFIQENNQSLHAQLIGVGHSLFGREDSAEFVESVFSNTDLIRRSMEQSGNQ